MTPIQQEILKGLISALMPISVAFITRNVWRVFESLSVIPKLKEDLNELYRRVRNLEEKK